jgi:hypothetical protein
MQYRWRDLSFEAPTARDDSAIVLLDPNSPPQWNVSVREDELRGENEAFQSYVEMQQPAKDVHVERRDEKMIAGKRAFEVEQHLRLEDGTVLTQRQAFVLDGRRVVIVTATSRPSSHRVAKETFERLISSLRLGEAQ